MSKIATITFHWAVNYGAVMQAYALQRYLLLHGVDTQIIDYIPRRVELSKFFLAVKQRDFGFFRKRKLLKNFCSRELKLTEKTYRNNRALFTCADMYDAVICGSDQIWNESFTNGAEGKPTFSYFLNFAGKRTKRIAYAVSFGTKSLSEESKKNMIPHLKSFDRIAVRESSGKQILEDLGYDAVVTLDPTLLLQQEDYRCLFESQNMPPAEKVFSYILHEGQTTAQQICHAVQRCFGQTEQDGTQLYIDPRQWLYRLANAKFVVTNSFHGAVFSILFHRPFVVIPVERSGMNDRIETLMTSLGLSERIASSVEEAQKLLQEQIDWDSVDAKLCSLRTASERFLDDVIQGE